MRSDLCRLCGRAAEFYALVDPLELLAAVIYFAFGYRKIRLDRTSGSLWTSTAFIREWDNVACSKVVSHTNFLSAAVGMLATAARQVGR